jgi:hypothetical protein
MKTYETILKKNKLVSEIIELTYECDDSLEGLLDSALRYVPVKELKKWKQEYLKQKEGK